MFLLASLVAGAAGTLTPFPPHFIRLRDFHYYYTLDAIIHINCDDNNNSNIINVYYEEED